MTRANVPFLRHHGDVYRVLIVLACAAEGSASCARVSAGPPPPSAPTEEKAVDAGTLPGQASTALPPVEARPWTLVDRPTGKGRVRCELVLDRNGERSHRALAERAPAWNDATDEEDAPHCGELVTRDVDGDGFPEALVRFPGEPGVLWTGRAGRIERYAPADGLDVVDVRDVDGDGSIDLEYVYFRGVVRVRVADPMTVPIESAVFVAHAVSGGAFVRDDALSIARAKQHCPARPASFLVRNAEEVARRIACGRLWGMTRAAVLGALAKECARYWKKHSPEDGREKDPCLSKELNELHASDPPFTLK